MRVKRMMLGIVVIATFGLLTLTACSSSGADPVDGALLQIPRDLSSFQAQILEDLIVTEAEYLQSVQEHEKCVASRGFETTGVKRSIRYSWEYSFGMVFREGTSESEQEKAGRAYDECAEEYSEFVSSYYFEQQKPTGAEREEQWQIVFSCLKDFGIDGLDSSMTGQEIVGAIWAKDTPDGEAELNCLHPYIYLLEYE